MTSASKGIVKLGANVYEIRVRVTCPRTGKRKEIERVRECTLTEAKALQHTWREELLAGLAPETRPRRQRLRDFVTSWLRGRVESGELKPSSADKIAVVWDLHIATSHLADLHVDDVHEGDVQRWLEELRSKRYIPGKGKATRRKVRSSASEPRGYSRATIRGYYRVLRTILNAAGAEHACRGVKLKGSRRRANYLTSDELAGVLAHVRANAPDWYPAVLLDAFAGLRWGELSALRWSDVDEETGVIRVERGNYDGRVIASTKTGDDEDPGAKLVPLLPQVADVLRAHRQRMLAAQHPGLAAGWIFPTAKGTLHKGSPLRKVLDAACAACGARRITPHGLRHTANDLLRRVADGEVVRAIIGHATEAMTHHYSHVDERDKRAAVARAFDVVAGVGTGVMPGVAAPVVASSEPTPKTKNPAESRGSFGGATRI